MDQTAARTLNAILGDRPREVFRHLVEAFLSSGEPVGSRTLSQRLPLALSPASIRNVMADLETMGLLYAPHTSAGRAPTEKGLRLFVDGLLEVGELSPDERASIEARMSGSGRRLEEVLTQATSLLSGLSNCAGLVVSSKQDAVLKHVEFTAIAPGKAMVIMVSEDGQVENRLIDTPKGLPASALSEASNYLNARLRGRTLDSARAEVLAELEGERAELDVLTARSSRRGWRRCRSPPARRATPRKRCGSCAAPRICSTRWRPLPTSSACAPFRGHRAQERPDPPARTRQGRRRRAHLHRVREPAVQPLGLLHRRRTLCQRGRQDRGRDRRARSHPPQLWPHHPMVDHTAKVVGRLLG
ncbi:MAG: heat-inducible transcriptional repressor HrcA [Rhizomicrobium sp.]